MSKRNESIKTYLKLGLYEIQR